MAFFNVAHKPSTSFVKIWYWSFHYLHLITTILRDVGYKNTVGKCMDCIIQDICIPFKILFYSF